MLEHLDRRRMAMLGSTDEIDEIQASLLRALASAHRLRVIHRLGIGPTPRRFP